MRTETVTLGKTTLDAHEDNAVIEQRAAVLADRIAALFRCFIS